MGELRLLTAGESHGEALIAILEGLPANIYVDINEIRSELKRRRLGVGRGERMQVEEDELKIIGGLRYGKTLGSPIAILIKNSEWDKWKEVMSAEEINDESNEELLYPRPGHADLAGVLKYNQEDIRNVMERASARETAARVAAGAVCKIFLKEFNISLVSHIISIGKIGIRNRNVSFEKVIKLDKYDFLRCVDKRVKKKMIDYILEVNRKGDTLGGIFEIIAKNVPPGLGSYAQADLRLDADLAGALMSIPAIKGVEIGLGFQSSKLLGSKVHDAIYYDKQKRYYRKTNNAGGIEGGISNGEEIRIKAAVKPIPSLKKLLPSVNIITKEAGKAIYQRSDVSAINPAAIIGENVVAFIIAKHFLRKFGGDSLEETYLNYKNYLNLISK